MSDLVLVRGIDQTAAQPLFDAWKKDREWVRSIELQRRWEPQELEINGHAAVKYLTGKHKSEFAELVLLIDGRGGQVIHLMLHRREGERLEQDLVQWATRWAKSREA